jgi:hypothetical protein
MQRIENGHYRYLAAPELSFDVFRYEGREYNRNTGDYRTVKFWSFRKGSHCADGYATRKQAEEAALRHIAVRAGEAA